VPICATGTLRDFISAVIVPNGTEDVEMTCTVGWEVLVLCGINIIIIIIMNVVSCHRPLLPGTSLEPAVIPTAQASSFTLQYFPYYV
jgi:glucan phosphoethanolaminetransferase (alkaline phosphatase superfamily)